MPGLVEVLCGHPEYSLCARRSILLLFCFFAKTCSRDSKSIGPEMSVPGSCKFFRSTRHVRDDAIREISLQGFQICKNF